MKKEQKNKEKDNKPNYAQDVTNKCYLTGKAIGI